MPTTIEDLEAAVEETISQAHSILFLNHNILKEYEDRQRKVIFCNLCLPFFIFSSTILPSLTCQLSSILATMS